MRNAYLFALFALTGCSGSENAGLVIEDIKEGLIDPYSAQFENVRVNDRLVCGEVNAKNRMGAFTGSEDFLGYVSGTYAYSTISILKYDELVEGLPDDDKAYLEKKYGTLKPFELNAQCVVSGRPVSYENPSPN